MKKQTIVALAFSWVMVLGCGLSIAQASDQGIGVGAEGPCVVLKDVQPDGTQTEQCIRTRASNIKYILLEFSSVMCGACQQNLPVLSQLASDVQNVAATRMVLIDRNEALIRNYLKNTPKSLIHFPAALDTEREAKKAYGIYATPTLFVLDQDNRVVYKHVGTLSSEDVEEIKQKVSE